MARPDRIAQPVDARYSSRSPAACRRDSLGSATVARATPNTPSGNSIRRWEKLSQLMLPDTRKLARMVSRTTPTCAADEPMMTGTIKVRIRRTFESRQPHCGRN